jgi:hypothetical protein
VIAWFLLMTVIGIYYINNYAGVFIDNKTGGILSFNDLIAN